MKGVKVQRLRSLRRRDRTGDFVEAAGVSGQNPEYNGRGREYLHRSLDLTSWQAATCAMSRCWTRCRTAHHATVPSDTGWYQYDTIDPARALMANVLVRDLDDDVLKQLKASAKAHGRSLQAEIHDVLRNASARRMAETRRLSAQWLRRLRGTTQTDSAALIREDRDTR